MSDEKWGEDTWKTPIYACLNCGYEVDAASISPFDPEPRGPQEGDVTICLECSHVMIFTAEKTVRNPSQLELDEITADPDTVKLLEGMRVLRQSKLWRRSREAASHRARKRGVVLAKARQADKLKLPQDRDAEGRAVETGGQVPLPADRRTPSQRKHGR